MAPVICFALGVLFAGCARAAEAASMMCTPPSSGSVFCSDGQHQLDDQTSSPTLNLQCQIP